MATKDPYRFFRIEAAELQDQIGAGILALEKGADPATLTLLLRLAHTLKGAARVVRQLEIAERAHALEDILTPLRDNGGAADRAQIDALLALHDQIVAQVATLGAGTGKSPAPAAAAASPASPASPPAGAPPAVPVMAQPALALATASAAAAALSSPALKARTDEGDMDTLLDAVSQAHRQLALLRRGLAQARQADGVAQTLASRLGSARSTAANGRALAQELSSLLTGFGQRYEASLYQMDRELEQVRDSAERLRLTPSARLFVPLQRAARDAAQALGKSVEFEGIGGEVRLDGEGAEPGPGRADADGAQCGGPRHRDGLAAPGRWQAGAGPRQRAGLAAGRRVAFECTDDGAGLDLDALREKARSKGWTAPDDGELDAQALLQFLLRGGISTAQSVNELAGRGVGLDVVRDAAERLGGEVRLRTDAGQGSTLSLIVPLRMAALEVLQVEAGGVPQALPLDAVKQGAAPAAAGHRGQRAGQHDRLPRPGRALCLAGHGDAQCRRRCRQGSGASALRGGRAGRGGAWRRWLSTGSSARPT